MSISKCSKIEVKEVLKTCLQLSGTQSPAMEDFDFIVDFVLDNYGIFKLKELKTAFEMLAADKLSVDKHIIFNPKLIGEVMSAYKKIAVQVRQKTQINEINETRDFDTYGINQSYYLEQIYKEIHQIEKEKSLSFTQLSLF